MKLLLVFLVSLIALVSADDHHKYCESCCNGIRCIDCEKQGYYPPFTPEQCEQFHKEAPISECQSKCPCTTQFVCGPPKPKPCDCSSFCNCTKCRQCEKEGKPPPFPKKQCEQFCEAPPPVCQIECPCDKELTCGDDKEKHCNCEACCNCAKCEQCYDLGKPPPFSDEQCDKFCQIAPTSECGHHCACKQEISCRPEYPNPCDCGSYCKCSKCEQCYNLGKPPLYTDEQCDKFCQEGPLSECGSQCACSQEISCRPEHPKPCDCGAYCGCTQCHQCYSLGKPPLHTDEECDKFCQIAPPSECGSQCACTQEISCGHEYSKPCDCGAYCACTTCNQCHTLGKPPLHTEKECEKLCLEARPLECGSKCACSQEISCGPEYQKPCDCGAYCACTKCNQCHKQGKSPLHTDKECEKFCHDSGPPVCASKCACSQEIACGPEYPKPCDCGAYCACTKCNQCQALGKPSLHTEKECEKFCHEARPSECGSQCSCTQEISCGPENPKHCDCGAYCNCTKCERCHNQGKLPPYTDKECDQFCLIAPPAECGSKCACTEEMSCGPEKHCDCGAVCGNNYCKSCKTQTAYTSCQCAAFQREAESPACQNGTPEKPVICHCPEIFCPPACNCETLCACNYCKSCPSQTKYSHQQCHSYCEQAASPAFHNITCNCLSEPCPSHHCTCEAPCACNYCKSCPTQTKYSHEQCEGYCKQAAAPECQHIKCNCLNEPCPPHHCSCEAPCACEYCKSCPSMQTKYSPQQCESYCTQAAAPECHGIKCSCPSIPSCPVPEHCDCSAVCQCNYCDSCPTQTTYSEWQCKNACELAKSPKCHKVHCDCKSPLDCPPKQCNCTAKCNGLLCESCPTQIAIPPELCPSYIQEANSPECKKTNCICPTLACPKPEHCNCSAECVCSYCSSCETQTKYSPSECNCACQQSKELHCYGTKCSCPEMPACPAKNCNCLAKCFGPYCEWCPTQTIFPKDTCASYAREYKSHECKNAHCFCPAIELYCPKH